MMQGAFETGKYPNYLAEVGISDEQAREKISKAIDTIFLIRRRISAIIRTKMPGAWLTRAIMTHVQKA